jgi:hypothetical protein
MDPVVNPTTTPNPEPTPTPAPTPYDWSKDIPKGSEKVFDSFKGKPLSEVLKSHVEAQSVIGGSIRLPSEKDTPEVKAAKLKDIRTKLGVPESSDKYDLKLPDIHESFKWDENRLKDTKAKMHEAGLTTEQANAVLGLFANELKSFYPDHSKVAHENKAKLVEEYGSELAYERNIAYATKSIREFGGDEFVNYLETTGLGNHPAMVKFAAKIGRELAEHGGMEPASGELAIGKVEAEKKINAIMNDKTHPYFNKTKAGHEEAVEEMQRYYQIAAGEI